MSRELTSHKVGALNEALTIEVLDPPGAGGASLSYAILVPRPNDNAKLILLDFQSGDPNVQVNGISNEALLAILEDRLAGFQSGPFACEANEAALFGVRAAMSALHRRTRERAERGVEGTLEK